MGRQRLCSSCYLHVNTEQKFYLKVPHNLICTHGSDSTIPGVTVLRAVAPGGVRELANAYYPWLQDVTILTLLKTYILT